MTGTIKKREIGRLFRQIKKRSNFEFRGRHFQIGNAKSDLPSSGQMKFALQKRQRRSLSFLTRAWTILSRFRIWLAKEMYQKLPDSMKKIVKKIGKIEARFHKIIVCIEPRLKRRYGHLIYPEGLSVKALKEKKVDFIQDFIDYVNNGNVADEEVQYVEDCFSDMERPRFGYSVKLMLKENEPCTIDFENPDLRTCNQPANTDNEGVNRVYTGYFNDYAQSRQTGEGFRSAAPPDCRIEFCGTTPTEGVNDSDYVNDYDDQTNTAVATAQSAQQPISQPAPGQVPQPVPQPINLEGDAQLSRLN